MTNTHDVIAFNYGPKVGSGARIQLGLSLSLCFILLIMLLFRIPVYPLLAAAIILMTKALLILGQENTPICSIGNKALEFKNPNPLGILQLIPLDSILSVDRGKRRIAVKSTYQPNPIYLPLRLFKPEQIDDLQATLNQYAVTKEGLI
ncbi:hypothetical protein [Saccharospirillum impatiens]|uniref:hypothetical protein n=1 Tax=Saccharospirillum impatiens TaxID=169438 RepID=UPI0012F94F4C|nr:hypothetical protein [Saccharospirillum impatiens]